MFDIIAYWNRIGFTSQEGEDRKSQLFRLHRCHALSIPFEGLDPYCKKPVSLVLDDVFDKIILHPRGGYCFELNLLFHNLLKEMGYQTKPIFCRPYSQEGARFPLTHRMTLVSLDDQIWICDVGLGGNGWREPLLLEPGAKQPRGHQIFEVLSEADGVYTVTYQEGNRQRKVVSFTTAEAAESDFVMSNYYTSTFPASTFVNHLVCIQPTETGRYSVRDNLFKIEQNGNESTQILTKDSAASVLKDFFHICPSDDMLAIITNSL